MSLIVSIVVELFADSGALGDNFPPLPDHFELTYDELEKVVKIASLYNFVLA